MEHSVLKNILHVRYWEEKNEKLPPEYVLLSAEPPLNGHELTAFRSQNAISWDSEIRKGAYQHFENTLALLNETMDLCLR